MMLAAILSTLLLGGIAGAQDVQSRPFNLVIRSADKLFNGKRFTSCHTGAAIESLCIASLASSNFLSNTTEGSQSSLKGYEPPSVLVWNLPIGNGFVSESMSFYSDPSTNVAMPLFEPSFSSQSVTFDNKGRLAILSYLDDTQIPPSSNNVTALKNWYVCQTNYSGYQYRTLNWVMGNASAKPQNPSCVKVEVERKFV